MTGALFSQVADMLSPDGEGLPAVNADLTTLLSVIKNPRRRHAIDILAQVDVEGIDLGALSERVAGRENDKPAAEVTATERKRAYIALQQVHLETLEEAGLLEMRDRDTVYYPTRDTFAAAEIIDELETVTGGGL